MQCFLAGECVFDEEFGQESVPAAGLDFLSFATHTVYTLF